MTGSSALDSAEVRTSPALDPVARVVASPGRPLGSAERSFHEARFGHDFSRVRVHSDREAQDSVAALGSRAYAFGPHVVLGRGAGSPGTVAHRRLLAHELTHTVQQEGAPPARLALSDITPSGHPLEREADAVAERVSRGQPVRVHGRSPRLALQRQLGCEAILNLPEVPTIVRGLAAHAAITADFTAQAAGNAANVGIPGASSTAYRTEGCGDPPTTIRPQVVGGRAGTGYPDLGYRRGAVLEIAEIKAGTWTCLPFAEAQLANYVAKGMAPSNREWRAGLGITAIVPMATSRFHPTTPLPVPGGALAVSWCSPGVIVYRGVTPAPARRRQRERVREPRPVPAAERRRQPQEGPDRLPETGRRFPWEPAVGTGLAALSGAALWKVMKKKLAGKIVKKAVPGYAYASAAAALILVASGKAEARIGLGGEDPLGVFFDAMAKDGTPVPPEIQEMLRNDPALKERFEEVLSSGGSQESVDALNQQFAEVLANGEFSPAEIKQILDIMVSEGAGVQGTGVSVGSLRQALEHARFVEQEQAPEREREKRETEKIEQGLAGVDAETRAALKNERGAALLFAEMLNREGAEFDQKHVERFLALAGGMTPERARELIKQLQPAPDKSADEVLDSLEKAIEAIEAKERREELADVIGNAKERVEQATKLDEMVGDAEKDESNAFNKIDKGQILAIWYPKDLKRGKVKGRVLGRTVEGEPVLGSCVLTKARATRTFVTWRVVSCTNLVDRSGTIRLRGAQFVGKLLTRRGKLK